MNRRRFVVLDRDGTIIVKHPYLSDLDRVTLLPGVSGALLRLRTMGFGLVVITNQSGIGRGYFDREAADLIHRRIAELLGRDGAGIDGFYLCAHKSEDGCVCRKPNTGLLDIASQELGFDPKESIIVGDNICDIEFGKNAGAKTILVRTGEGALVEKEGSAKPDHIVDDLSAAVPLIMYEQDRV